ncbi:hypothetical protein PUNSTDRAFT_137972 [Punctularia strigosozonata HHB-11173 SS5]|uniref:CHAT domain-containing protein n=1 Tax=Punctularia strigosozonata (strain HHB-11173) TaxID=741275 RepID=R7S5J0_PUNST|nr:uncharacterized protein PUNSTDRAFT_137972 [Punctularia strigosozonata HHB-11173 SS5]EIN05289.1 hypothetical protein PUNSTDRAFT_137972 [Punctularia strigosozonata HHB-11173 SS5]
MNERSDLDYAATHGQEALALCRAEAMTCPNVWTIHAHVLNLLAQYTGASEGRKLAETLLREAIWICPADHPLRSTARYNLAALLNRYYEATQSLDYLTKAIETQQLALAELLPSQSLHKHRHLRSMGTYMMYRFEALGDPSDLDEYVALTEEALQLCPESHIDRGGTIRARLWSMYRKCIHTGALQDLNTAIDLGRRVLEEGQRDKELHSSLLSTVASLLDLRHQLTLSNGRDIEESVQLHREALDCSSSDYKYRWMYTLDLARCLAILFAWSGQMGDLEEAIRLGRQLLEALPIDHPQRSLPAMTMADALVMRFAEAGEFNDLNEAIGLDRQAMAEISPSNMNYSMSALGLISRLCMRYETLHGIEDVTEAVSLSQVIVDSLPESHINKLDAIRRLAYALLLRGQRNNTLTDIEKVVQILESGIETLSQGMHGPECLRILASGYLIRFRHSHMQQDATRAMECMNRSLEIAPHGRRERFRSLLDASRLYIEHGTPYCNVPLALKYFHDALSDDHRDVRSRIQGAIELLDSIELSHKDVFTADAPTPSELLDVYAQVVGLLPRVAFFGLHLHSRLRSLSSGQNVALTGASQALNLGDATKAVEMLEQGRAVFWTHTLRLRSPFDEVPGEFKGRLAFLARQLDRTARRNQEVKEFNALLKEMPKLHGMDRFLLPDEYSTLARAANRGPIVILVSSMLACHAVIIKPSGQAINIPLRQLTESWLVDSGTTWRSAATEARSISKDRLKITKSGKYSSPNHRTHEILRLLWVDVVRPILDALDLKRTEGRNRPRLWWCPTGQFVHLPVHAAGADDTWCSDYVVSSYTPTLGALISARAAFSPVAKRHIRALVAAVPQSHMPQWASLPSTRDEAAIIRAMLPDGTEIPLPPSENVSVEGSSGVTAKTLLEKLPDTTILHLACHGYQDRMDPLRSGFAMQDEMLTIERLMPIPLSGAFMAFLSACETAKGDKNQPDQAVHLAATLLLILLRSMEDVDGPVIAKSVYEEIYHEQAGYLNPDDIPYALDRAVQNLRRIHADPSRWASYIHLGI